MTDKPTAHPGSNRRQRKRHAAATARIVASGLSASTTFGLVAGLAVAGNRETVAFDESAAAPPEPTTTTTAGPPPTIVEYVYRKVYVPVPTRSAATQAKPPARAPVARSVSPPPRPAAAPSTTARVAPVPTPRPAPTPVTTTRGS